MAKPMFDPDALIDMFSSATAKQGEQLKQAVSQATLAALQGRELTLRNIKAALKAISDAASAGAAKNMMPGIDAEALLDQAVAGMDDALLRAVEANRVALTTLAAQGADLRDKHVKKALDDLDKLEDTLMATLKKAADGAGASPLAGAWGSVLEKMQAGGTLTGAQAAMTTEKLQQMAEQVQGAMRSTRHASLRAAQALAESYTAMVSGVLIGMSDALGSKAPAERPAAAKSRR
jgi:hypothetical protein